MGKEEKMGNAQKCRGKRRSVEGDGNKWRCHRIRKEEKRYIDGEGNE